MANSTTYDIGRIADLSVVKRKEKNLTVDVYQQKRGYPAKYRIFSRNVVCYYHDKSIYNMKPSDIVQTVNVIEDYINKIGSIFNLKLPALNQGKRYALYLSNTGLHPEPGDCTNGVIGAGSEYVMMLHPDVINNIALDTTVIVHELGHGFFQVGGVNSWLEESLCEYLTWFFVPSYQTFYDRTLAFVFQQSWVNPLSASNKDFGKRYNGATIWSFIGHEFGHQRIGEIANNAWKTSSPQQPPQHDFERLAIYLKQDPKALAMRWAISCINLEFFSQDHQPFLKKFMAGRGLDKNTLAWNIATFNYTPQVDMNPRTEVYGFEVSQPVTLDRPPKMPSQGNWLVRYLVLNNPKNKYDVFESPPPNAKQTQCRLLFVRV